MRFFAPRKLLFFLLIFSTAALADTWTSSVISSNTTWIKNNNSGDGIYVIDVTNDTLVVESSVTLTIEPGVTVKFHDDVKFLVYGTLVAQGAVDDSIKFIMDDAAGSTTEWGGIKLLSTDSTNTNLLSYCLIEDGDADGIGLGASEDSKNGGGIYFGFNIRNNTEISHCTIQNNHAYEGGGGLAIAGSPVVTACLIQNNAADQYGGGVSIKGPTPTSFVNPMFGNNIIVNNSANGVGGGGIGLLSGAILDMTHGLVLRNSAANGSGGGIYLSTSTTAVNIANSVIGENTADSNPQIYGTINVNIGYSNIEDGYAGVGNIDQDPAFLDPNNGDYHFGATSALVDVADNSSSLAVDFDGTARPFDGDRISPAVSDMGPYEYVNTAPQITSTAVLEATEDQPYSYQVTAYDPDLGETLTYSLTENPTFVTINAATGEVSGLPDNDAHAGDYLITVQVADLNGATDTQDYTLTVTAVNDQPVVADIGNQGILEGESFTTINLDDYVEDEESPAADFNWSYSGNLQLSVSIVNRVATISTPIDDWYGSETITFTATDPGSLSDSDDAVFTVTNINDAPIALDVPDQEIAEGSSFIQINLDDYVNDIDNVESDLDWAFSGNSTLNVSIDEDRVATISAPNEDWFGSETITFTVTDPGGLDDSDAGVFTVTAVNDAPVVAGILDQEIAEGQTFSIINLDDFVNDVDDPITVLNWSYSGNLELTVSIDENRRATVSIPDTNWYGSETVTFTATDTSNDTGSDDAEFTVTNVNDAPVVSQITDETIDEGDTFASINLNSYVADVDDTDENINWVASGNTDLIVTIDEFNQASIETPNMDWFGSETVTFNASDPGLLSDNTLTTFTVNAVNDVPVVADIPNQTITEGGTFAVFDLDTLVSDVDDPDNQLTWAYSGNSELIVSIDLEHIVTITIPDANWNGSEEITFTATDTSDAFAANAAVFTVNPYNDPPVVSSIPDQTIAEGDSFLVINLNDYVTDVDNEHTDITWSASGNIELEVYYEQAYQTMVVMIPDNWFGNESIQFKASDPDGLADSTTALFTVTPVNDAPVLVAIAEQVVAEGQAFSSISLDDYVSDVDDADSTLNWDAAHYTHISVVIEERVLTVSVLDPEWNGSNEVMLFVADTSGLQDSLQVTFTVNAVNDPVYFSAAVPKLSFNEDDSLDYAKSNWYPFVNDADDADSTLAFNIQNSKELLAQDSGQDYRFKSLENWFGSDSLLLTVSDGEYIDSSYIAITVFSINDAPQIVDLPQEVSFDNDTSYVLNLFDYMQDVDTADSLLVWTVSEDEDSLMAEFNDENGQLTFSIIPYFKGTVPVVFSLSDDSAATVYDTVDVIVSPATGIEDLLAGQIPDEYKLNQNYPNPFNPATAITYQLKEISEVDLSIYNILGQRITTLVQEKQKAGYYRYTWDGSSFANGVYFYRIQAGTFNKVCKMILMK